MPSWNKGKKCPRKSGTMTWLQERAGWAGDECLIWPFSSNWNGYGLMNLGRKTHYAHRSMCKIAHGEPPTPKHQAAHSCNNGEGGCVNPRHLSWKTPSANLIDRRTAGTVPKGGWNNKGTMSDDEVAQIIALKGKKNQREIGAMFGISYQHVSYIQNRRLKRQRAA